MKQDQLTIQNWFDKTYRTRGFGYLRPLEAYEIFSTILSPKQGHQHLDVACGLGLMLKTMASKGLKVFGIDLSGEAVKKAQTFCPDANIQQGNAEMLPYEDESFDSITCIGSLERMLDREKVIQEQLRVAKQGAKFCLMVRNSENFTWKYIWKPLGFVNRKGHQDALNLEEWKALFEKNGLKIEAVYPDHWPYFRLLKTFQPWRKIKTGKLRKFPGSMRLAYEYIFLMTKA